MSCLFCSKEVSVKGDFAHCERCGMMWAIRDGRCKITESDWQGAFGDGLMPMRDHLTMRVRELLYDFATDQSDLPPEGIRFAVGLLLDLHCHLEGVVIGLRDRQPITRPYPSRPDPYPPRRRDPRMGPGPLRAGALEMGKNNGE